MKDKSQLNKREHTSEKNKQAVSWGEVLCANAKDVEKCSEYVGRLEQSTLNIERRLD